MTVEDRLQTPASEIAKDPEQRLARALINNLFVLLKTAYMHQQNNAALIPPLEKIQETLLSLFQHTRADMARLRLVSKTFFLNDTLVRMDQGTFQNAEFLAILSEELDIGEWEFQKGSSENDLRTLMVTIVEGVRGGSPLTRSLGTIQLQPRNPTVREAQSLLGLRQLALHAYAVALAFGANMLALWSQGKGPRLSAVKRVLQGLVDVVEKDPKPLLGLMHLGEYRKHAAHHFVNVAVLSLVIARRAGFTKSELVKVGMTAFLHEVGVIGLSRKIIDVTKPLRETEAAELAKLPLLSVCRLAELWAGSESLARLISVYENRAHIPSSLIYQTPRDPDPVSEIIMAADAYDHLTRSRLGNAAIPLDQALDLVLANPEGKFAEWAMKLLAEGIGHCPIGTLVELDTGELGIVFDLPVPGARTTCPRVRVIRDQSGAPVPSHVIVNLSETNPAGQPLRTIGRTLDPEETGVNVAYFFLD